MQVSTKFLSSKSERAKHFEDIEEIMKELEPMDKDIGPDIDCRYNIGRLSDVFLADCERDLKLFLKFLGQKNW